MNTNDEILVFEDANGNELKVDTAKWKLRKGTREMNANELADELDSISYDCTIEEWRASPVGNAAAMLRQQHEQIEALKAPKMPLLEQEIKFILGNGQCWQGEDCSMPNLMYIIRAVEVAHGIGVKQK